MNFNKIISNVKEAIIVSGYSRTAKELLKLSERQLNDIGVSRELLTRGGKAYPWRDERKGISNSIPANVTKFRTTKIIENSPIMPSTPKAA